MKWISQRAEDGLKANAEGRALAVATGSARTELMEMPSWI